MKEVRIQNEYVEAVVSQQGAEVISFKRKDNGIETIWSRDPAYWTNCNPILFPYTGPLKDGHYEYNGKTYELGQHGFARRAVFEFDDIQEDIRRKMEERFRKMEEREEKKRIDEVSL